MIEIHKKTAVDSVLVLKINEKDYQPKVDNVLKEYRYKVNIPGFRKGFVPMPMLKSMYEKSIKFEEINNIIQTKINDYITKENLNILGSPIQVDNNINWDEKDFEFNFEIGLVPEIKLNLKSVKLNTNYYKISFTDKELADHIEKYQQRLGKEKNKETVEQGDLVYGVLQFEGEELRSISLHTSKMKNKDNIATLLGKKKGDEVKLSVKDFYDEKDYMEMLTLKAYEDTKNDERNFSFKIDSIFIIENHEINQDFYDRVLGKGKASNEEEFKEAFRKVCVKSLQEDADRYFLSQAMKDIVEQTKLDTPDEFLKKWLIINNKEITNDNIDEVYKNEREIIKRNIMEGEILKSHGVFIKEEDIMDKIREVLRVQIEMYNIADMDSEKIDKLADNIYKQNEKERDRVINLIRTDKLMDVIKTTVKYEDREVSFGEYMDIISTKNKK